MKKSIKDIIFFYSVLVGVVYAPLVSFLSLKTRNTPLLGLMQFFTSDTFYYLSIARHSVGKNFYTSDGIFPTNGFHPLWGFVLTKLFGIPGMIDDRVSQIYIAFGLSMLLVVSGTLLFSFVVYKITDNFGISLLAAVPGFYYLIFLSVSSNYDSTWSFINGMESPFSIFLFGAFSYLAINKRIFLKTGLSAGIFSTLLVTLIIFSRLDDIFLLVPYLALMLFFSNSRRQALIRSIISIAIPITAISIYLLYNHSYAGSYLPVSGLLKHGNWLVVNLLFLLGSVIPAGLINLKISWSETSMRALQMCIPAIFSFLWLLYWFKKLWNSPIPEEGQEGQNKVFHYPSARKLHYLWLKVSSQLFRPIENNTTRETWIKNNYDHIVIAALAFYVVLKGAYNFVYVYLMGQGHWYYPISIMIFNLMFAVLLNNFLKEHFIPQKKMILNTISILAVMLLANSFISNKISSDYNSAYYEFWASSPTINKELTAIDQNMKIVEYDDGVMAYFIDIPTMNGFGFTLDTEAFKAQDNGHLLELAYKRGFRVLGVMSYINFPPDIKNDSDLIRNLLREMPGIKSENLDPWAFEFLYKDPNSSAVFIKFEPAP